MVEENFFLPYRALASPLSPALFAASQASEMSPWQVSLGYLCKGEVLKYSLESCCSAGLNTREAPTVSKPFPSYTYCFVNVY